MPERAYPGAPRFPSLSAIAMVQSRIERGGKIETERRSYISSRALTEQEANKIGRLVLLSQKESTRRAAC
jgi:hypothetical protein